MSTTRAGIGSITSVTPLGTDHLLRKVNRVINKIDRDPVMHGADRDFAEGYKEALCDVYNLTAYGIKPGDQSTLLSAERKNWW